MAQPNPTTTVTNPRIAKLIELEVQGKIKPEHQQELDTYRAQGLAPKKATGSLTEAQGKSTGFYERALEADKMFTGTESATHPRGLVGQTLADVFPGTANTLSSSDRQMSEQAKRNFIAASLRYESGAAVNKDEFEKQDQIFFPQPGDGPDVIAQKAKARQTLIEGLKTASGPGATGTPHPAEAGGTPPVVAPAAPGEPPEGPTHLGAVAHGDIGFNGGSPEQANMDQLAKEIADNGFSTADQILAYAKGKGVNLNAKEAQDYADYVGKMKASGKMPGPATIIPFEPPPVDPKDGAIGAGARGLVDAATLNLAPRLTAIDQTLREGGTYSDNLIRQQGFRKFDEQNHGVARFVGSLPAAAAIPIGGEASLARMAITGGAVGGAYGLFGSPDLTNIPQAATNAVTGAAIGAGSAYGLGKLSDYIRMRPGSPPTPPPTGNAVVDAATNQNVPIVAADAFPGARGATRFLETVPGSTGVVRSRLGAGNDALEQRVGDLAGGIPAADREGVGEAVQTGAQNWIRKSSDIGGKLYDRAYQLSNGAQATPTEMLQTIDSHLADLGRTPAANKAKIDALNTLRSDLVDAQGNPKPLDIDSLRNIRSGIREQMDSANVRSSDLDRRLDEVMQGGKTDIQGSLVGNPRALAAFDRADQFWADRVQRVDNVLQKVIGKSDNPISGEQVMAKIESMAAPRTGNAESLRTLMSSLRPDERQQVAANVANALGRETPEADFSAARLWTQAKKLSPKARTAIFGSDGAQALGDLATIAEARSQTLKNLNNSGSGFVSNWWRTLTGIFGTSGAGAGLGALTGVGTGAGAGVGLGLATAGITGANISARLLTNPTFVRWAAQGLKASTKEAALASINRLGRIATSDPGIKTEVLALQEKLTRAANDNFVIGSAAASGDERQQQQR